MTPRTARLFWQCTALLLALVPSGVQAQLNLTQVSKVPFVNNTNDIWGYTDPQGTEYVLLGTEAGVSILDIGTPSQPVKKQFIPGPYSIWRDLKTWSHYAFVVHDNPYAWNSVPEQGLLIIDLDSLNATAKFKTFKPAIPNNAGGYDTLKRAHNLYIDENGICYLFGANVGNGGALMFDVATDPWNPQYVGIYDDYYFHDGMVRGDTLWGSAVYVGKFCVVDVSNKAAPALIGQHGTPNSFTHNTWISDNNKTLFCTDEQSAAYVTAYDVSDLNAITELDRIQTSLATGTIPHNAHVYQQWVVTSYYTSGVQIVDAKYTELLVEVGYFDTSPNFSGNGFYGNWGAYPYFNSELIACSDIEEGLYLLSPEYVQASRVFVEVYDSITKAPMGNVTLKFGLTTNVVTNIDGEAAQGTHLNGQDTLRINHTGFVATQLPFSWNAGQFDTLRVALLNVNNVDVPSFSQRKIELFPNPAQGQVKLAGCPDRTPFTVTNGLGQSVLRGEVFNEEIPLSVLPAGQFFIQIQLENGTKVFPLLVQ